MAKVPAPQAFGPEGLTEEGTEWLQVIEAALDSGIPSIRASQVPSGAGKGVELNEAATKTLLKAKEAVETAKASSKEWKERTKTLRADIHRASALIPKAHKAVASARAAHEKKAAKAPKTPRAPKDADAPKAPKAKKPRAPKDPAAPKKPKADKPKKPKADKPKADKPKADKPKKVKSKPQSKQAGKTKAPKAPKAVVETVMLDDVFGDSGSSVEDTYEAMAPPTGRQKATWSVSIATNLEHPPASPDGLVFNHVEGVDELFQADATHADVWQTSKPMTQKQATTVFNALLNEYMASSGVAYTQVVQYSTQDSPTEGDFVTAGHPKAALPKLVF